MQYDVYTNISNAELFVICQDWKPYKSSSTSVVDFICFKLQFFLYVQKKTSVLIEVLKLLLLCNLV